MTTRRVLPPPAELVGVCDRIEEAAGLLLKDVLEPYDHLGRYESDVEARVLFSGLLRHLEALIECARADLVLLPAASTITRAAFEQGVKIRWLLHPSGAFEREARFLAHLSDEERMWERCARIVADDRLREHATPIREFRIAVEEALPVGISPLPRIPALESMLAEIGEAKQYSTYTVLSQYAHGSHYSGSIYRRGLGTKKEFGEWVSPSAWALLLEISWWSLFNAGYTIERVCAGRHLRCIDSAQITAINSILSRLRSEPA